ncbi:Crp/Fnr family transcriptional regulator [Chitinophaga solisilvae]|uniref:Crp/Fnr family transcriptional regulator n=1 Tax=Chitinophaga solisilvae TaxID=1233460 RepID=A0A3S1D4K9_9BACT|nr:Crp/Fnr family transcriptional regulator [Chitinophaga solisilvae]NSL85769.1 Crp/Fnr family transcriptional regulator [Chitinophaga solisilvae]
MEKVPGLLISHIATVAPLPAPALELFTGAAQVAAVKKGTVLLAEGSRCRHIWYIENGACRTFHTKAGKEINTSFYFENTFFTNLASLRAQQPSVYTIQTYEDSILWRWQEDDLYRIYQQSPDIVAFGKLWLEKMLIEQETHNDWLKVNTPEERYQSVLTDRPTLLQRVSLTQLSSYIGISRETLSRIRKRTS